MTADSQTCRLPPAGQEHRGRQGHDHLRDHERRCRVRRRQGADATAQRPDTADEGSVLRCALGDVLLEWMANSTVARSNANASERSRMEDPTAWLEVETETKSQNGSSPPPGWWEPSAPGQSAQSGRPAVPDQDALCYRSRPGTYRLAVVVCDGAGRAAEGRIGAPAAAVAVLESGSELTGSPNQDRSNLLRCTDTTVRQTMIQLAATSGISLREYAATPTALIQANGRGASAQVGDGAGVVGAVAGWMLTSEPQRGEHANETWFHPGRRHLPWVRKRRDHRSAARHGRRRRHDGPHAQATRQRALRAVLRRRFSGLESNHSRGKASGRCRTLLLGNQVRLLTDDDVTMIQATLLHPATETEDQPQKDRSHHGKAAEYSTGSTA